MILPFRLQHLALETFGKFTSKLVSRLTRMSQTSSSIEYFILKDLYPTCKYLENSVCSLPPVFANEITKILFNCVLKVFEKSFVMFVKTGNDLIPCSNNNYFGICEELIIQICYAIFHPSTNEFKFDSRLSDLSSPYASKFVMFYLNHIVLRAEHLTVLEIEHRDLCENLNFEGLCLKNLERFSSQCCTDAILEALSKTCKQLKYLDITKSIDVTDESIKFILEFKLLEHLEIMFTGISPLKILKTFGENCENNSKLLQLTSFGSSFKNCNISLVPKMFSNLTSLKLQLHHHTDLTPLKKLNHLTKLGLYCKTNQFNFSGAKDVLQHLGHRLLQLNLVQVEGTDLRFVAENCQSLQDLTLIFTCLHKLGVSDLIRYEEYPIKYPLPEFRHLQSCTIHLSKSGFIRYILSKFVNVKKVELWYMFHPIAFPLVPFLSDQMKNGSLEELIIDEQNLQISKHWSVVSNKKGFLSIKPLCYLEDTIYKMFF